MSGGTSTTNNSGVNKPSVSVETKELKPLTLTKNEGWFKLGDSYIVLRFFKDKSVKVSVIRENSVVGSYVISGGLDCSITRIVVDEVDICSELAKIISNYAELVE
ncbi:MAG: hypothetical protein QXI86_08355, partial [Ignisphaera sp.]